MRRFGAAFALLIGLATAAAAPAGVNTGGSSWAASLSSVALLDLLGLLNDGRVTVSFRFQPIGLAAKWQIDDLYVDPLKMG